MHGNQRAPPFCRLINADRPLLGDTEDDDVKED